jgi:hypothetical protein
MERKKPVMDPRVDLGVILGGLEVTFAIVSRMEARERRMGSLEAVTSQ